MTGRARIIITALVSVVLLVLFYFFFIRPRQNELSEVRSQVEAETNRTQVLQGELNRLRALQEQAPQLREQLAELEELVPERNQVPNFIFQVQEAANRSGVGFLQISPQLPDQPLEGAAVAEITVSLRARGGYFAIQDFIRRLYDLDRALRIDSLTMTGAAAEETAAEEGRIELQATSRIFFELPEDLPPAAGVQTAPTPVPAATPTPSPSPTA